MALSLVFPLGENIEASLQSECEPGHFLSSLSNYAVAEFIVQVKIGISRIPQTAMSTALWAASQMSMLPDLFSVNSGPTLGLRIKHSAVETAPVSEWKQIRYT